MNLYEVLRRPLITEKSTELQAGDKYAFEVSKKSTKPMIAAAGRRPYPLFCRSDSSITMLC